MASKTVVIGPTLQELIDTIASGAKCTQMAGDGPFVYAEGRKKRFASRIARKAEREGLMALLWCHDARNWRWFLTDAGRVTVSELRDCEGAE